MSNGPIKNCAAGICCPPPLQEKALAVTIKEVTEGIYDTVEGGAPGKEFYLRLAAGLMERGLIGVSEAEAAHLKKETSPTEEELDRMLEE